MKGILTAYEASLKYPISGRHIRRLLGEGKLKGREAKVSPGLAVWLVDEASLRAYTKKPHKTGPKPRKK